MKTKHKALIYALTAVILWSTVATAFKIALQYVDYLQLLCYSSLTSLIALFVIIVLKKKLKMITTLPRKEIISSALLGILNPFLYYMVLFRAYSILRAQEALVLNYTWAIMIVLLSVIIMKQKFRLSELVALFISFSGIFVIASKGTFGFNFDEPFGICLALGSSVIWALFWILNIDTKTDETVKLFISFISGFVLTALTLFLFGRFSVPSWQGLLSVGYVGLFEMGITFVFWLKALNLTDNISKTGNLVYLSPFLSLIFIGVIINESISITSIAGLILILAGIIIQQFFRKS